MKLCTMFGDYLTPDHVQFLLEKAILRQYKRHNVKYYICGNRGNFDILAQKAVSVLKKDYPELKLILLQLEDYVPSPLPVLSGFDGIYKPVLKHREKPEFPTYYEYTHILDMSDCAICHTHNYGNIGYLYEYALEREMRGLREVYNLAGISITMH